MSFFLFALILKVPFQVAITALVNHVRFRKYSRKSQNPHSQVISI